MINENANLPTHQKTVMDSGLRVLSSTLPHTAAVSIMILFGAGSRYEDDDLAGASHVFEHLLFKGTGRRPTPAEISQVVEGVGGALNAFTDREMTGYWCRVPKTSWIDGLDVLTDMVLDPLFRDDDIAREKQVVFEEIRASHDSPESQTSMNLDELLWPNQPFGRDIAGSEASVAAISKEAMLAYMATQYVPKNTVVAIAGAVEHDEILAQLEKMMKGWATRESLTFSPVVDSLAGPVVKIEHRPTEQAHMVLGMHGLRVEDEDRYPMRLLSVTLGESMSSRLFEEVREKRGLAYAVGSSVSSFSDTGSLEVFAGVDPERAEEAVKVIVAELGKIREDVTAEELVKAKALTKGRTMLRMEESRAVAMSLGAQEMVKGHVETVDEMLEAMDAVTLEDVSRVAERVIKTSKMGLSLVGPFDDDIFLQHLRF